MTSMIFGLSIPIIYIHNYQKCILHIFITRLYKNINNKVFISIEYCKIVRLNLIIVETKITKFFHLTNNNINKEINI